MHHERRDERKGRASLAVALMGTVGSTFWMANRDPFWLGPLWGALLIGITAGAWVVWLVPDRRNSATPWRDTAFGRRDDEAVSPVAALTAAVLVLAVGAGLGGYRLLPLCILAALVCFVPPALRRPGLGAMIAIAMIYLPLAGTTSLWDPWETHYGEVAREILARNDWISLWWAQDKWFWSKPALLFWMEALSMGALGVDFLPDANPAHPEWAIRLPTLGMSLVALATVYGTVRRTFGSRAGVIAMLVTATMPQFFFISHQAITDMPLVAAITVAVCCLLLAIQEDADREASLFEIGPLRVSLQHAVLFALFVIVLPQAIYLVSRNLSSTGAFELAVHSDRFLYGSFGNADVPGNPTPRNELPALRAFFTQPGWQGVAWMLVLAGIAFRTRLERRTRTLWMIGFYIACGVALLAKGLAGVAIPGLALLLYLVASRRWGWVARGELRLVQGALVVSAVGLPWYIAMYVRHGHAFVNRLLIHDHVNRLAAGVHGDEGTIQYFVTQIGYAAFPWIALLPLALAATVRSLSRGTDDDRNQAVLLLCMWAASSFALFSAMVTKYHHYILPTLVPTAILIGISLDAEWGPRRPIATWLSAAAGAALALGVACFVGDPRGVVPPGFVASDDWVLEHARPFWGAACVVVAATLFAVARWGLGATRTVAEPAGFVGPVAVALILGACLLAFVGRDLSWTTSTRPQGNERLAHLFVYNYRRAWPDHLDYRALLTGVAFAATSLTAWASFRRWRPVALRALMGVAIALCTWGVNVYMTDLAGHWGVRDLVARYYAERRSPEEPLLAWQMNWKGENFYTGNRVHVFVETDNARIENWLAAHDGRKIYVILERKRLARFERLVGAGKVHELSTPREQNKYVLLALEI